MGKIDDVRWYRETANSDTALDHLRSGEHIGIFFKWLAVNNLIDDHFSADFDEDIEGLKNGTILIVDFAIKVLEGKLVDNDFKLVGRRFSRDYYEEESEFHKKYASYFMDFEKLDFTQVAESKYELLAPILDHRLKQWEDWLVNK